MKLLRGTFVGLFFVFFAGCTAQKILLGTKGQYLLTTRDNLVLPGEPVTLIARVQSGDMLKSQVGCVVRFYRDGRLYRVTETNQDGQALVCFQSEQPGDIQFQVVVSPVGLHDVAPAPQTLRVSCRNPDTPMVIVDLDKTIVASGFHTVLLGDPEPAEHSQQVLHRLAQTHTIVYLTHRPDYFSAKTKIWIENNGFPPGPVLLSTMRGFLKGSKAFKSERIAELRRCFTRLKIGIGDKFSDVLAYHKNQLKAFLLVQFPNSSDRKDWEMLLHNLESLPAEIQAVRNWSQINTALFQQVSFPPVDMTEFVKEKIRTLPHVNKGPSK